MRNFLNHLFILILFFLALNLEAQGQNTADRRSSDDAWSAMDSAFNSAENEFTQADEYYLGRAVAANILSIYRPYTQNPELTRYLNRICQTLAINSQRPVAFNGYHVMILDSAEFNAFSSPGGHIFLTKKLVDTAGSEDMLAAVIAHELAHIMLRHSVAIIDDMKLSGEAASMANKAAALSGKNPNTDKLMLFRNSVAQTLDTMMKSGYSQAQEFDADREAVTLLANAGYDPGALLDMLKVLQKVQSAQRGGFNSTHPSPAERIVNVNRVNYKNPQDTRKSREPRFKRTAR